MKKSILLFSFLCATAILSAQAKGDYTWPLGYGSTYDISPEYDGMLLGFGQSPPSLITQTMLAKPIAFICDSAGNLLLYFNGCMLANGQHEIIENSDSINLGIDFSNPPACEGGPMSGGYQNALLLQKPGTTDLYYLFYIQKDPIPGYYFTLLYSIIDMSLNGGAGKVILKNQPAQVVGPPIDLNTHISAVRHGNGRDWWIVCPTKTFHPFRLVLLLSPEGIAQPYFGSTAAIPLSSTQLKKPAQIGFSADGSKYFRTIPGYGVEIMDFDRCTGRFSNVRVISSLYLNSGQDDVPLEYMGAVSSPSGRFLYISTVFELFQFDLWSDSILTTKQKIAEFDVSQIGPNQPTYYQGYCAPDGKIYFGSSTKAKHLHVVKKPDLPDVACEFEALGFPLPAYPNSILPNFPHFRLLDLQDSPCDTLGITGTKFLNAGKIALRISPNPSTGLIKIDLPEGFSGGTLYIVNAWGQVTFFEKTGFQSNVDIDLQGKPASLYWIVLQDKEGKIVATGRALISH
jgi:hypothetical protein